MSDTPSTPATPPAADADAALARMTTYGRKERRGAGPLVLLALLIALAAIGWVAWQQRLMQTEVSALRADNAALQQLDTTDDGLLAQLQQRQQELDAALRQREQELNEALEQRERELGEALQRNEQELDAALQQREQQLNTAVQRATQQSVDQLQAEILASDNARAAQAQRIVALERELAALRRDVGQRVATEIEPHAEAEALLRLAQQRLSMARDVAGAITLYRAADAVLLQSDDPDVFAPRNTLARELAALESVEPIDVPGLFARLGDQGARVQEFAVVSEGSVQDFSVDPVTAAPATGGWWSGIKQTLGEYFVVTSRTAEILPQLGTAEQFLVRAQVRLHIEQARLALLDAEPQVYRAALDDALALTQRWLRGEAGSVEEFVAGLKALRDTPIVTELPNVGVALAELQQLAATSASATAETTP